jgi:hypothetical protein
MDTKAVYSYSNYKTNLIYINLLINIDLAIDNK